MPAVECLLAWASKVKPCIQTIQIPALRRFSKSIHLRAVRAVSTVTSHGRPTSLVIGSQEIDVCETEIYVGFAGFQVVSMDFASRHWKLMPRLVFTLLGSTQVTEKERSQSE